MLMIACSGIKDHISNIGSLVVWPRYWPKGSHNGLRLRPQPLWVPDNLFIKRS